MNLFNYIYYKAHQVNLKNNNFGDGEFGSLLAGTFAITMSFIFILLGMLGYLRIIFDIDLFFLFHNMNKFEYGVFVFIFIAGPVWFYLKKKGKKIIEEYDKKSSISSFYNLSPYLVLLVWYLIVTAWLMSAIALTP